MRTPSKIKRKQFRHRSVSRPYWLVFGWIKLNKQPYRRRPKGRLHVRAIGTVINTTLHTDNYREDTK